MPASPEKKDRVKTFKLEESLEKQIDEMAEKSGRTKDGQIRHLVLMGIKAEKKGHDLEKRVERIETLIATEGQPDKVPKKTASNSKRD